MTSYLSFIMVLAARAIELTPTALALGLRWIVLFAIFAGLGAGLRSLAWRGAARREYAWMDFWNGWAASTVVLQLWNLWRPIDGGVVAVIAFLAVPGVALRVSEARRSKFNSRGALVAALGVAVAMPWLTAIVHGPIANYDTGLYHLASVSWSASHATVPGLGNLHDRLAFNSTFHLYASLLDALPLGVPSYRLANGLPWLVLMVQLVRFIAAPTRSDCERTRRLFSMLILLPMLRQPNTSLFNGLAPDFAVFAVQGAMAVAQFSVIEKSGAALSFGILALVILSAFSATLKLSAMIVSVVAIGLCVYAALSASTPTERSEVRRCTIAGVSVSIALIVAWLARGIILSGYPLYPADILGMPVEWRIPRPLVVDQGNWIASWARTPGSHWSEVLGNAEWVYPWIVRNYTELRLPLIGAAIGALLGVVSSLRFRILDPRPILYMAPWLAGVVFWLVSAPDPRFALGPIWITYAAALSFGLRAASRDPRGAFAARLAVPLGVGLLVFGMPLRTMAEKLLIPAAPAIPEIETSIYTTASGLQVLRPVGSDMCWGAPLPCTPYPRASLRARRVGDLGSGFVLDDPLGCIDMHSCRPDVVRSPDDIGVAVSGLLWPGGGLVGGQLRLHSKGGLILYTESARSVRLKLHVSSAEFLGQQAGVEVRVNRVPAGRQRIEPGHGVEFSADLRRGFNVTSLRLVDEAGGEKAKADFSLVEIISR